MTIDQVAETARDRPGVAAMAVFGAQAVLGCALFLDELGGPALTPNQHVLLQFYSPPALALLAGLLAPHRWTFVGSLAVPAVVGLQMALNDAPADDVPENLGLLLGIGLGRPPQVPGSLEPGCDGPRAGSGTRRPGTADARWLVPKDRLPGTVVPCSHQYRGAAGLAAALDYC